MILRLNNGAEINVVPNNEASTAAIMRIHAYAIGFSLLQKHGLYDWTIICSEIDRHIGGSCYHESKKITINSVCFDIMDFPWIEDIILHEIAHALVGYEHGHDNVWHLKAIYIGCSGLSELYIKDLKEIDNGKYKITF